MLCQIKLDRIFGNIVVVPGKAIAIIVQAIARDHTHGVPAQIVVFHREGHNVFRLPILGEVLAVCVRSEGGKEVRKLQLVEEGS